MIGKLLLEYRSNHGFSQTEAAQHIGIAYSQYNGLETGRIKKVSGHTLKKLSAKLGVPITSLRTMLGE